MIKRAKAFIGLDEGRLLDEHPVRQMELGQPSRRDRKQGNPEEGEYEIIIYDPKVYEDSLAISQQLRGGNPVIVNLKHLEPAEGTRLIDFVCGTAYAVDGHMLKIAESIFLFTPKHIFISDIEGRQTLEAEFAEEDNDGDKFFRRR